MLNRYEGIGNLGRDPEMRYSTGQNQTAICKFTIAVDKGFGQNKKTVWVNIVTFGKVAENCNKFLAKGRKVYVAGELDIREYDKQDGTKGYVTEVAANTVEFLSEKQNEWNQPVQKPKNEQQTMTFKEYQAEKAPAGFQQMAEQEYIPF